MVSSKPCKRREEIPVQNGLPLMWVALSQESFRFALGRTALLLVKAEPRRGKQYAGQKAHRTLRIWPHSESVPILLADLAPRVTATRPSGRFPVDNLLPSTSAIATAQL